MEMPACFAGEARLQPPPLKQKFYWEPGLPGSAEALSAPEGLLVGLFHTWASRDGPAREPQPGPPAQWHLAFHMAHPGAHRGHGAGRGGRFTLSCPQHQLCSWPWPASGDPMGPKARPGISRRRRGLRRGWGGTMGAFLPGGPGLQGLGSARGSWRLGLHRNHLDVSPHPATAPSSLSPGRPARDGPGGPTTEGSEGVCRPSWVRGGAPAPNVCPVGLKGELWQGAALGVRDRQSRREAREGPWGHLRGPARNGGRTWKRDSVWPRLQDLVATWLWANGQRTKQQTRGPSAGTPDFTVL